jgi:hypothetical protein
MKIESKRPFLFFGKERHKIVDWKPLASAVFNFTKKELKNKIRWMALQIDGGGLLGTMAVYRLYVYETAYGVKFIRNIFKNLYGTSTGSIIVALFNVGWTFKKILRWYVEESREVCFKKHFLGDFPLTGSVYDSKPFIKALKGIFGETTFAEMFRKTGQKLNISVVNVTDNRQEVWNYETRPNTPVRVGVLASCATLWYHKRVEYNGKIYADGGLGARNCMLEPAVMDAMTDGYRLRDILIASFGCGRTEIKRPNWFLRADKARYIMEFSWNEGIAEQVRNLTKMSKFWKAPIFFRENPDLREAVKKNGKKWAMDDTDGIDDMIEFIDKA